jgi:hypothetical protein
MDGSSLPRHDNAKRFPEFTCSAPVLVTGRADSGYTKNGAANLALSGTRTARYELFALRVTTEGDHWRRGWLWLLAETLWPPCSVVAQKRRSRIRVQLESVGILLT